MDTEIFNTFHSWTGVSVVGDWLIIVAAKYLPWGLAFAAALLVFCNLSHPSTARAGVEKFERFIFVALALLLSRGFLTEIIRYFAGRKRPFAALEFEPLIEQSATSAFPSGHAAIFFALAVAAWFINRKWGYWLGVLALVNGVARVIAGVHWPSDILAGAVVGIISALAVRFLLNKIPKRTAS